MTALYDEELLTQVRLALPSAWSRRTSNDPKRWSSLQYDWGQCAVTALLVRRLFGGDVLKTTVEAPAPGSPARRENVRHYYNRLPGGRDLDLTAGQFAPTAKWHVFAQENGEPRVRNLPFGDGVIGRYVLLRRRLLQLLGEEWAARFLEAERGEKKTAEEAEAELLPGRVPPHRRVV